MYWFLSNLNPTHNFTSQPKQKLINGRNEAKLDCSKAEVMLAKIPLISQRMVNPKWWTNSASLLTTTL